jgi:hypothetical protein
VHAPAIAVIHNPVQQSELCDPVHQLDRGVMPNEKEFCQVTHRNRFCAGKAFDSEKCLVLLWCQPGLLGSRFAE